MQTIKIKLNSVYFPPVVDVEISELRRVIKENKKELFSAFLMEDFKELLQEEKLPFVERMIGKEYWWIDGSGDKIDDNWDNHPSDTTRLSINNVFFTESDCDKEIARRKALGNIMSYIRDNEIKLVKDEDWKDCEVEKYQIAGWYYECDNVNKEYDYEIDYSQFSLAFYSQEDREKVIENCKEDLAILLKK